MFFAAAAGAADAPPPAAPNAREVARAIAKRYGIDGFKQVEALRFTFNARFGDMEIRRRWDWTPASDTIVYEGPGPDGTPIVHKYVRRDMAADDQLTRQVDAWFINDKYWLLFPFQLMWDENITLESKGLTKIGILPGMANELAIHYGPEGGYTPGDTYELFYEPDYTIVAWNYVPAAAGKQARAATWEDNRQLGPIVVSTRHRFEPSGLLWFSDLSAKVAGKTETLAPAPAASPR